MKNIKKFIPENWEKDSTCRYCLTTFTTEFEDVRYMPGMNSEWDHFDDSYYYVECPVCLHDLAYNTEEISLELPVKALNLIKDKSS